MLDFDKIAADLLDAVGSFGKTSGTVDILSAALLTAFNAGQASVGAPKAVVPPVTSVEAPVPTTSPTDAELVAAQTAAAIEAAK